MWKGSDQGIWKDSFLEGKRTIICPRFRSLARQRGRHTSWGHKFSIDWKTWFAEYISFRKQKHFFKVWKVPVLVSQLLWCKSGNITSVLHWRTFWGAWKLWFFFYTLIRKVRLMFGNAFSPVHSWACAGSTTNFLHCSVWGHSLLKHLVIFYFFVLSYELDLCMDYDC